jgi:hypothetical protein
MKASYASPAGVGGFFSLFNLPPAPFSDTVLERLGQAMTEARIHGNGDLESGYVYLGQFIAHDVSRLSPPGQPSVAASELEQLRSPGLDLDSLYGSPGVAAPWIDTTTGKLKLGPVVSADGKEGALNDLPRDEATGKPLIPDERNEDNLLVAQLHVQFLKLHNAFVSRIAAAQSGMQAEDLFSEARHQLTLHYQQILLYDYLQRILDPHVWGLVVLHQRDSLWPATQAAQASVPVEFAAAAFRFGHTMVRTRGYQLNATQSATIPQLFEMTWLGGLQGRTKLLESHVVDWKHFFRTDRTVQFNRAQPIRPNVTIVMPDGQSLASRNLATGKKSRLPAAQAIVDHILQTRPELAKLMGLRKLTTDELNPWANFPGMKNPIRLLDRLGPNHGIDVKTPLWYYILAEAKAQHGGARLGTLGSLIVGSTLRGLVELSRPSIFDEPFRSEYVLPTKAVEVSRATPTGKTLCMADLLGLLEHAPPKKTSFLPTFSITHGKIAMKNNAAIVESFVGTYVSNGAWDGNPADKASWFPQAGVTMTIKRVDITDLEGQPTGDAYAKVSISSSDAKEAIEQAAYRVVDENTLRATNIELMPGLLMDEFLELQWDANQKRCAVKHTLKFSDGTQGAWVCPDFHNPSCTTARAPAEVATPA